MAIGHLAALPAYLMHTHTHSHTHTLTHTGRYTHRQIHTQAHTEAHTQVHTQAHTEAHTHGDIDTPTVTHWHTPTHWVRHWSFRCDGWRPAVASSSRNRSLDERCFTSNWMKLGWLRGPCVLVTFTRTVIIYGYDQSDDDDRDGASNDRSRSLRRVKEAAETLK